jgi:cytochrome oxidase Cu insertion factor (SCO1/SenC/PrrC family)
MQDEVQRDPRLRARERFLSVSFDPVYDTPEVLAAHARRVGAEPAIWTMATGEREAIEAFARAFGVSVLRQNGGPGDIVHNLRTAVIDPGGRIVEIHSGNEWKPADVLAALKRAGG